MNSDGNVALLSPEQAVNFVQDILEIQNVADRRDHDRAAFLDEIISSFQQKIPFQTITNISRSQEDQRLSTMDDIEAQIFSRQGGLCYDLNIFMYKLLETLGFDVHIISCNIGRNVGNHCATIAHDLEKPGDLHYVEVGVGEPFFRSIPLNFETESKLYRSSYLTHKFIKSDETYIWLHEVNARYRPMSEYDTVIDGWNRYMVFTLEPKQIQDFREPIMRHYVKQDQPLKSFLNTLRSISYPDEKMVAINDRSLLMEDEEGNVSKRKITSKAELLSLYQKYFPQLPTDKVLVGIDKMGYSFEN